MMPLSRIPWTKRNCTYEARWRAIADGVRGCAFCDGRWAPRVPAPLREVIRAACPQETRFAGSHGHHRSHLVRGRCPTLVAKGESVVTATSSTRHRPDAGNFWLFGGYGYDSTGAIGSL